MSYVIEAFSYLFNRKPTQVSFTDELVRVTKLCSVHVTVRSSNDSPPNNFFFVSTQIYQISCVAW